MNIALWVVQCGLTALFAFSGVYKGTRAKDELVAAGQTGISAYSDGFIRFIAAVELLGCVGLIVPWLVGIARVLTPLAAVGLAVIMVGAAVSHTRLALANRARRERELRNVATNVAVFGACLFVAIERFRMLSGR